MIRSREFRELLVADVALVEGLAVARDVALAVQRYWDEREREGANVVAELSRLTGKPVAAFASAEATADRIVAEAGGDARIAVTRRGALDRSVHVALSRAGSGVARSLREAGATARAPLREMPGDRYVDFEVAGEGGMGLVYLALDTELNRLVAFKMVRPDAGQRAGEAPATPVEARTPARDTPASRAFEELKHRFLQEAWVTGGLEHPGVVPVYELGQTPNGIPYYTMRFVRGQRTLRQAIDDAERGSVEGRLQLLEPFLKVCDTIRYAHARGVLHRDLKPENIALGEFGEVVLLDWGLAKLQGREDGAGSRWQQHVQEFREAGDLRTGACALGTPGYMSPEAALGLAEAVDARSDVYSLGAMLYEILAGRLPFRFSTMAEYVLQARATDPPAARSVNPQVPEALSALCSRALARDPSARPPDVEALAQEIRAWQTASALEREAEALRRDVARTLEGADDLAGADRLRQVDRAAAALHLIEARRPDDPSIPHLERRVAELRERGHLERERATRRRVLVRMGAVVLVLAAAAGYVVAARLEEGRREARASEARTQRAYEDILRLSDTRRLRELDDGARAFSAVQPDLEEATTAWLGTARDLAARRSVHLRALEEVRRRAAGAGPPWRFPDDGLAWQHDVLAELTARLLSLEQGTTPAAARVRRMHEFAVASRTSLERDAALWETCIEAIRSSARYGGLAIVAQPGLVPLGPDPASGLFEFAHLGSGAVVSRDPASGRLVLPDDAGLVFVLIPGGSFWMGAQATAPQDPGHDAQAEGNEAPVRRVTVSPFLLAKHECTQAQWSVLSDGADPSFAKGPRLPVEHVSWEDAVEALGRFGFLLPSEAQWEYACRAGTTTRWWISDVERDLEEAAWHRGNAEGTSHPVGAKRANAFGLHDVHGNVWEWCADAYRSYEPGSPTDPLAASGTTGRIYRGGAWSKDPRYARSANRGGASPGLRNYALGLRPARLLAPR